MNNSSPTNILLALLLALSEPEISLSRDERERLVEIGDQLRDYPQYWLDIAPELIEIIESNVSLHRFYLSYKAKLDALDGRIPLDSLPSPEELEELFPESKAPNIGQDESGYIYRDEYEIIESSGIILGTGKPDQNAREQLQQIHEYTQKHRFFNCFFRKPHSKIVLPSNEPLVNGQRYQLCIEINPERRGIETQEQAEFPDEALKQVFNDRETLTLEVAVASKEFKVEPAIKSLNLPRTGASEQVGFIIEAKSEETDTWGDIYLDLFYRGYLLQSKKLTVRIVPWEDYEISSEFAQTAKMTFTTTNLLTPEQLAQLPERVLTVSVDIGEKDNCIDLRFLDRTGVGKELKFYDNSLTLAALGNLNSAIRKHLYSTLDEGYEGKIDGSLELLNAWLPKLAIAGYRLYKELLQQNNQREILQPALQPGSIIQINSNLAKTTIPWAVLYERKVDYSQSTHVCNEFVNRDLDCTNCPLKHNDDVVCPHAFWGFRYSIEQLPSSVTEYRTLPEVLRKIQNNQPLNLSFNIRQEFDTSKKHQTQLQDIGLLNLLIAHNKKLLETHWQQHGNFLDMVYFYCHCGMDELIGNYLELDEDERIYGINLDKYKWKNRPLVFLNACGTGAYSPDSYDCLVENFLNAGACGVVGTECEVFPRFAAYYATETFQRLFTGQPLGQAMLEVRRDMLKKYFNPLGLVYSLYASHEIVLASSISNS